MSCIGNIKKDPQETIWATMDWTLRLGAAETIASSSWTIPTGVTKITDTILSPPLKTSVKVSGGTAGTDYTCTNTIVTSEGQTLERAGVLAVRQM